MKYTEKEFVNRLLAIIDACSTTSLLDIQFNGNADEKKGIKNLFDDKYNIAITPDNKINIIKVLADNLDDFDFCHYWFRKEGKVIAQGFDNCEINTFNPNYFINSERLKENLFETEFSFSQEL